MVKNPAPKKIRNQKSKAVTKLGSAVRASNKKTGQRVAPNGRSKGASKVIDKEPKARVRAKYVHMAPRKVRRVAALIRGTSVAEAENILANLQKRATRPVSKALKSVKANAVQNHSMDEKKLFIEAITVNESLTLSRFRPRAQGRAFPIRKRFAHIDILLNEQAPLDRSAGTGQVKSRQISKAKKTKSAVAVQKAQPKNSRAVIAETKMK